MYPLVFLSGLALIKKDHRIVDYLLTLSVVGFFISLYQNYLYYTNSGLKTICQIGGGVSCVKRYVLEFGYVTIPLMALTAFVIITMILVLQKMYGKYSE
jgi:disulfide bond formation protein DsbB